MPQRLEINSDRDRVLALRPSLYRINLPNDLSLGLLNTVQVLVVNLTAEQVVYRVYRSRLWRAITARPWLKRRLLRLLRLRPPEEGKQDGK